MLLKAWGHIGRSEVWGLGFWVLGGFRMWDLGFKVLGVRFRVLGV